MCTLSRSTRFRIRASYTDASGRAFEAAEALGPAWAGLLELDPWVSDYDRATAEEIVETLGREVPSEDGCTVRYWFEPVKGDSMANTDVSALVIGDYLARYEDTPEPDPGSRCGYSDPELDDIRRQLAKRGLVLAADDVGLLVTKNASDEDYHDACAEESLGE